MGGALDTRISFVQRRHHHDSHLESELLHLIDLAAVAPLEKLIVRQNGCESNARTIKVVAFLLFFSVINSQCSKPGPSPHEFAKLTNAIFERIPPTLRDWSCPTTQNGPPNSGKELFRFLIQKAARSFLKGYSEDDGGNTVPCDEAVYDAYGSNADKATTLRSLKDEGKFLLVEFIAELVGLKLLPPLVVYEYSLELVRSTAAPNPTPSDLEAICRLLRIADQFTASESWSHTVFNALELVERRDRDRLDKTLRLLLLVKYPAIFELTSSGDPLDWKKWKFCFSRVLAA
jgi:hypothetical protein